MRSEIEAMSWILQKTLYGTNDSDRLAAAVYGIAATSRGRNFLELGVRAGGTTLPLLAAAHHYNGVVTSVDIEDTDFMCPDVYWNNWRFIKSDAHEFLRNNTDQYDLIYIDDWHDGIHVKTEIELLEPLCSKSTVILLHDLMYGYTEPEYNKSQSGQDCGWGYPGEFDNGGPYWAVDSLNKDIWEYATLPYCNGLTILRKK